jgi:hypothetical protein
MYTALLKELEKKGKIKDGSIEFYSEHGKLKILIDKTIHIIKDNNTLIRLINKNHKISKAVDTALEAYF